MLETQNRLTKNILLSFFLLTGSFQVFGSQGNNILLKTADSLFSQNKYMQSYELYNKVLDEKHLESPAMLLKMAYINEGINNYAEALYYLNLYYQITYDTQALKKMDEIAEKYDLKGYGYTDLDYLKNIYAEYYIAINSSIISILLIMLAFLIYIKLKKKRKILIAGISYACITIIYLMAINFSSEQNAGIIIDNNALLMDGPSSGADLISQIPTGNKMFIISQNDIWSKVEWDGKVGFVKNSNFKAL
ncbi:SH3 domain-containing protein [Aureibacter tunicatorum]|uniref:SH3b domain-containing protein n=1 Tax=Aureibacter tunicatorum TaxID=866807 RepID=A0AAE4BRA8_9BACT|nr:hypothetical protein [Aureibacter tunicatorum]MDR6237057.1 hypothetical protein [Aureibacter tunicatorum]BDD06049.1 hypothetical protein AUTU_35320 [Aureibacter tunicatorum]